jgi:hypothetical protein
MNTFVNCDKCGKRLIERKNNIWHFAFGKSIDGPPPVELFIIGTVKIKCIRKSCGHWNVLFPEA